MRILVVDDDAAMLAALQRLLEREGWEVSVAGSYVQAIRALTSGPQDLVLTDYELGAGGTGLDILSALRRECSNVPLIVMSGYPLHLLEPLALASGACAVFHKPIVVNRLLSACTEHARHGMTSPRLPFVRGELVHTNAPLHAAL